MNDHTHQPTRAERVSRQVFIVFAVLALAFLLLEHTAHVLGALPFLILLACPLLHVFMHGGHSHGGGDSSQDTSERRDADESSQQNPTHHHH